MGTPVVHQAGLSSAQYHWQPGKRPAGRRRPTPSRLSATAEAAIGGGQGPRLLTSGAGLHDSSPSPAVALGLPTPRPSTMAASVWCREKLVLL